MKLRFTFINHQEPGILASLLSRTYADLVSFDPLHWKPEVTKWIEFDCEAFDNLSTVGACVFLSWYKRKLVGFGSFDPRQRPLFGIIGHNCILPEFRRQGFGKQQVAEVLMRFIGLEIQTAKVTTNDHSFFVPAQKMYESCGFQEISREPWKGDTMQSLIHYQKRIG